jgi:hypothetical protein
MPFLIAVSSFCRNNLLASVMFVVYLFRCCRLSPGIYVTILKGSLELIASEYYISTRMYKAN